MKFRSQFSLSLFWWWRKSIWNCCLWNVGYFVRGSMWMLQNTKLMYQHIGYSNLPSTISTYTKMIILAKTVCHNDDVIMSAIASQITSLMIVYSIVYSDADQRKHQSSASLAFVRGIHRDRWIPRTNGQLRGKCFHLMTSSCNWIMF